MKKSINQEQFGANASAYIDSQTHARGSSLQRLVELTQPKKDWLVLDIATGAGHTAFAFSPHVNQIWASDITSEMLATTRQLAKEKGLTNIQTEYAEAEALPFDAERFDLITCRIAAHHFTDIPAFVSEAKRVLRIGGLLAVVDNIVPEGSAGDYINAFEKLRDPSHERCWSREEWEEILKLHQLEILQAETLEKTLHFEFWAKRHDAIMQAYLRSMLTMAQGKAARFLHPHGEQGDSYFHLQEVVLVARKN